MNVDSFYTRQMLLQYGKQLVAARRLARYDRLIGHSQPAPADAVALKRRMMVERVAHEITDNLIFSGSDNVLVHQVLTALNEELGQVVVFRYPPGEFDFKVFRVLEDGTEIVIEGNERAKVIALLDQIALAIVDATML